MGSKLCSCYLVLDYSQSTKAVLGIKWHTQLVCTSTSMSKLTSSILACIYKLAQFLQYLDRHVLFPHLV